MTSHPPGKCCVTGHLQVGKTQGTIENINGTQTYVSHPPPDKNNSKAILFLSDACGIDIPNSQLLADSFAAAGYTVVMPDLFHGNPHPINDDTVDLYEWLAKHPVDRVDPVVEEALKALRKDGKFTWVGAVGYCFGAKYLVRWLKRQDGKIDAGFVAHPSFVEEEELRSMTGGLSIAAAGKIPPALWRHEADRIKETDYILTTEKRHESEKILGELDVPWQICLYSDVEHSFAVRPDPSVRRQVFAKERAFEQALGWFGEYLME
jgi:dienelactone hydrolase